MHPLSKRIVLSPIATGLIWASVFICVEKRHEA
jgi:hypothetical protein